jgi:hypothetical protein
MQSFRLKDSVYVLEDPQVPGLYFNLRGERATLKPLRLSTLAPATPYCRIELCAAAVDKLQGVPHELVRMDA